MNPGKLDTRCAFQSMAEVSDGGGGVTTEWTTQFSRWGAFAFPNLRSNMEAIAAGAVQSTVMAWRGDMRRLYRAFLRNPAAHMQANNSARWWGDQGFIEKRAKWACWQDLLPGALASWKKHCASGVPSDARVIVFHGRPRPWEVE